MALEHLYNMAEVAAYLRVTDKTVRRWIKLRKIVARRVAGGRRLLFTRQDIEAALRSAK